MNSLKIQILTDLEQCSKLIKICGFTPNDKWSFDAFTTVDLESCEI
jgi:hypothetical protein